RLTKINNAILNGAKVVLKTQDLGEIKSTIWLPNFKVFNFSGLGMMMDMAMLIGLLKLQKLRRHRS
ncbi:MAG: hypothetical protein ABI550_07405, partial [Ignavibacteriaceae bacterium]